MTNHLADSFCNMLVVTNEDEELRAAGLEEFSSRIEQGFSLSDGSVLVFRDRSVAVRARDDLASCSCLGDLLMSMLDGNDPLLERVAGEIGISPEDLMACLEGEACDH